MTIERTTIRIGAEDRGFQRVSRRVKHELDDIEKEAGQATRAARGAGRRGAQGGTFAAVGGGGRTRASLSPGAKAYFGIRDEDITFGEKFKYGRQGFQLRSTYVSGATGGTMALGAVALGTRELLHDIADVRDAYDHTSVATYVRDLPGRAVGAATGAAAGGVATVVGRYGDLFGINRMNSEDAALAGRDVGGYVRWWWSGRNTPYVGPIREQIEAKYAGIQERRRMILDAQEEEQRAAEQLSDRVRKKIDEAYAKHLEKINVTTLPVRVSRNMYRIMKEMRRAVAEARRDAAIDKATPGAGS